MDITSNFTYTPQFKVIETNNCLLSSGKKKLSIYNVGLEKYLNDKLYPGVMGKPIESELVCNSEQEPMTPMTKMTEESELERSRKLER